MLLLSGTSAWAEEDRVAPLEPGIEPAHFAADFLWHAEEMPIRLCWYIPSYERLKIDSPSAMRYEKVLMQAFDEWNRASEGRVSMMLVTDQADEDVGLDISEEDKKDDSWCCQSSLDARRTDTAGQRGFLRIQIPRKPGAPPVPDAEIRSICLHEIGHLLGLVHSSDSKDVMYAGKSGGADHIGPGDLAQLQRLYGDLPKVDSTELATRIQKEHDKTVTWMKGELGRHYQSLKERPNDPSTLGGIARCYANLGRFDEAAEEYYEQVKLDSDKQSVYSTKWTIRELPRIKEFYETAQLVPAKPSDGRLAKFVKIAIDTEGPVPQADDQATQTASTDQSQPTAATEDNDKSEESKIPLGEAHFTPEQLQQYYNVYSLPDVKYLRTLFNAYLNGAGGSPNEIALLKKWDKNYYHSKCMVTSRNIHPFGGTSVQFMFEERPDKVFDAWVYPLGKTHKPELRALDQAEFSNEDIGRIKIRYKQYLEDKVHAM